MFASLNDAPRWWAAETPDVVAISVAGDAVTYRELDEWVDRVAAGLSDRGVVVGDLVGVVGGNSLEWVVAALAALRCGAVVAAFNHRFVARELAGLLAQYEPTALFAAQSHMTTMKDALRKAVVRRICGSSPRSPRRAWVRRSSSASRTSTEIIPH
jgi:fatty-acyl-CoA synthase